MDNLEFTYACPFEDNMGYITISKNNTNSKELNLLMQSITSYGRELICVKVNSSTVASQIILKIS